MIRAAAPPILLACLALGACDSKQVRACESGLQENLKSPSSYKRIAAEQLDNPGYKTPYSQVTITYDAANSFGVILRDKHVCFYRPGTTQSIDPFGVIAATAKVEELAPDDPESTKKPIEVTVEYNEH